MADSATGARREQAVQAIDRALDLLPQEDPNTDHAQDARRWIQVYRELIALKDDLLHRMEERLPGMSDDVRLEMTQTDETVLRHQRDHYRARLDYWLKRHWELNKLDLDPVSRVARHGEREVELTRREVELLTFLMESPGTYVTADQILRRAWGDGALHTEEVRTYVARLRKKLELIGAPTRIVNRPRKGYTVLHER